MVWTGPGGAAYYFPTISPLFGETKQHSCQSVNPKFALLCSFHNQFEVFTASPAPDPLEFDPMSRSLYAVTGPKARTRSSGFVRRKGETTEVSIVVLISIVPNWMNHQHLMFVKHMFIVSFDFILSRSESDHLSSVSGSEHLSPVDVLDAIKQF